MGLSKRLGVYLFAVALNAALLGFGVLMVCQGALHKLAVGEAEIRDMVVERASEPVSFWVSVGFDFLVGISLAGGAFYGFWLTFKPKPGGNGQDEVE